MSDDGAIEAVQAHLHAIWPEQMSWQTQAGLQWGQLVATAAVSALREHDARTTQTSEQTARSTDA